MGINVQRIRKAWQKVNLVPCNFCLGSSKNSPNEYIWQRIESLIDHMISEEDGIPVRNVKSLMSTIPSTFTGSDVVQWLIQHVGASDVAEAVNLASRIASMGYLFCIDDHVLTVKNDSHTYYRFQTPFLYPSRCMEADTAEAEAKVDKKRDKLERLVLDSQERAYWDVHRPPPGCVNTTDVDMRKLCRAKRPKKAPCRPIHFPVPSGPGGDVLFSDLDSLPLRDIVAKLNASFRPRIKTSKAAESLQNYCDQYSEFDLLLSTSCAAPATTGALGTSSGQAISSASTGQLVTLGATRSPSPNNAAPLIGSKTNIDKIGVANRVDPGVAAASAVASFQIGGGVGGATLGRSGSGGRGASSSVAAGLTGLSLGAGGAGPYGSLGHVVGASSTPNANFDSAHESVSTLNPWISDNPEYWNTEVRPKFLPIRRIKRWSFSIHELLKDPIGLEEFQRWLEKEFSAENLRFWQACQELKGAPLRELRQRVLSIYNQYLAPNAVDPLNVDSRISESIRRHLSDNTGTNLDRYCFEEAETHIFHLMKSDSYYRFLRSDYYRELFTGGKKKSKKHRTGVSLTGAVGPGLGGVNDAREGLQLSS
ncbi:Regulator of G-protein signaling 7 [Fasciola gigantica]|uniref:Regulator of G-protein signaling 7 n=1 Tax=Fasciola gigantica TaxID=46835 RepID=A0A504YHF2_FASGI|nr:Regulator of G-protein signaling 7 [Fasciola gigantica]